MLSITLPGNTPYTDASHARNSPSFSSMNKYRPTLAPTLASLVKICLRSIPRPLVRLADFVLQYLDTFVNRIEEFESNVKVLSEVDAVREIFLDVLRLLLFTLIGSPFKFEEVIEICLDGDTQASVDIVGEREATPN
jgi:hypothetical protein